ncbi:pentatricopeptide repeat-containing protein At5g15300 [Mercurialis annua]|uniref:pentatricopeptide repeat-containing protein At5g15300 n=1 Tax=Mercurialis annua TaxID=3986 RepID=UPI00215EC6EE|nr:pentatricopeptide repeat-containing protein At5g15300 [Mercurialis annua]
MIRKRPNDRSTQRQQPSSLWQNCKNLRSLQQIHATLIIKGFNSTSYALRELIFASAIVISGTMDYAHQLFDQITEPDIFMWNTMMRGSAQSQKPLKAISLYTQMENRGIKPDKYTFSFLLKACTRLEWKIMGFCIHGKVLKFGFQENTFVRNTLIYYHAKFGDLRIARTIFDGSAENDVVAWSALTAGYARRGELCVARRLFDEMPMKDLVAWNVMITAYVKRGEMGCARELFNEVSKRDVVTWNAMISGYVLCGETKKALEMFEEMRSVGEQPDEVTMLSLLSACADLGDLEVGRKVHCSILEMSLGDLSVLLGNAIIHMYAKCGSVERALEVFSGMRTKDVSTWNSVIVGLALHGHAKESIDVFTVMQRLKNTMPDEITFVGVLVACSHVGKVEEGRKYFNLMKEKYHIDPNVKHYGCMVDLLGRAGLLNEAFEFIDKMKIEPNAIIWRTLLGACRVHGNVELGRCANEKLLGLRRDESGDYVLLSNIYASIGEWDGAEKVRKLLDDSGARKETGYSLIEGDEKALMEFLFDSKHKLNSRNIQS